MLCRVVCLVAWMLFASPLFAQTDPLDLARGLRENGQPDLSLDYLSDLAKQNLPADVKTVLPLERAKTLLALAQMESEEAAREAGIALAKREFDAFLNANPKHPRVVEAQLALAQVTAVQAVGQLNNRRKIRDANPTEQAKRRAAAAVAARPLFKKASDLFGQASKGIAAQLNDASVSSQRKAELRKTSLQAELDQGINQYRLVDTFSTKVEGQELKDRADELDKARKIFLDLARKDDASPVCWQARAWAGMCEYDKSDRAAAEKIFRQVKTEGAKTAAGGDGVRMAEFFETFIKYDEAANVVEKDRQKIQAARSAARAWLEKDRYRPRMTPQRLSMTFYYARLTELLGQSEVIWEKQTKADQDANKPLKFKSLTATGISYFKDAAREYRRLLEFDNEYSELADEHRTACVRFIVGETPREPKFYTDLEECQMAGLLQLGKARSAKAQAQQAARDADADTTAKAKYDAALANEKAEFAKAIALLERAKQLVTPATPSREAAETKLFAMHALHAAEQYSQAAKAGEALARGGRGNVAAQAGYYAVDSYLRARDKRDESTEEAARQADRDKAVNLALFLDKTFPGDMYTDGARLRIGELYYSEKQYQAAFDILGKINPTFADVARARTIEGDAAFYLLIEKNSPLQQQQKAAIFRKAVLDCDGVSQPTGGTALRTYFALRTLLANLHLADPDSPATGYANAERVANDVLAKIAASALDAADKKSLQFPAEEARLRGVYGQALKLFDDGKYPEMADKMTPLIDDISARGPASAEALEGEVVKKAASLDAVRREFVRLAMQGRSREGEIDKAAQLFELLDKLGGSVEATTTELERLVALIRHQIEQLRKAKKAEEADKLSGDIGALLQKQAEKPKLPARVLASLGRSLRDLGQYEKAIGVLKKVPMPPLEKLTGPSPEEADRDAAIAYQVSQIELARAYRASKKFDDADKVLKAALGDDKAKGWAKSLEFKKEAVYLLEDKAAATPAEPKAARLKAWSEAKTGWEKLANQYAGVVRNKELPPNEREKFIPVYLELLGDLRRCIARGNSQILADNPAKLAESMAKLAQQVIEIETSNPKTLTAEVKAKFHDLLNDYPAMKEEYKKHGGKAFLDMP